MYTFGREKADRTVFEYLGMCASDSQAYILVRKLSLETDDPVVSVANGRDGNTAPCCRFVRGERGWAADPDIVVQKRCCTSGPNTRGKEGAA